MSNESPQRRHSSTSAILTLLGLLFICAVAVLASQSGRRAPKSTSIPAATPESSTTPTAKKSPEKPALPVILGIDAHDSFSNIPLYFYDSVLKSCADRLNSGSAVKVESSRNMNRGDAVKRAKSENEGYVILLQLRADSMGSNNSYVDLSRVYIEYFVFAPITARQVTSGNAYQRAAGYKDVIVRRTTSGSAAYVEYQLKQAARNAAEQILVALGAREPPDRTAPVVDG